MQTILSVQAEMIKLKRDKQKLEEQVTKLRQDFDAQGKAEQFDIGIQTLGPKAPAVTIMEKHIQEKTTSLFENIQNRITELHITVKRNHEDFLLEKTSLMNLRQQVKDDMQSALNNIHQVERNGSHAVSQQNDLIKSL